MQTVVFFLSCFKTSDRYLLTRTIWILINSIPDMSGKDDWFVKFLWKILIYDKLNFSLKWFIESFLWEENHKTEANGLTYICQKNLSVETNRIITF